MLSLGTLAFTRPWLLAAGLALPALGCCCASPRPRRDGSPFRRFCFAGLLSPSARQPARPGGCAALVIAALLIFALSGPVLNPAPRLGGSGPLLLVVHNGWPRRGWGQRIEVARELLQQAEREAREVLFLETAPTPDDASNCAPWPPARRSNPCPDGVAPVAGRWAAAREALAQSPGLEQDKLGLAQRRHRPGAQGQADAEQLADRPAPPARTCGSGLRRTRPGQWHSRSASPPPPPLLPR